MIDTQLVDRYVSMGDPAAFRALVERHGPSVLRTCRGLLQDSHEADDAYQATFLVLVRRAPSVRDPERLDRWLVGVARRVALRSRRQKAVRAARDRRWAEMHPEQAEPDRPASEIRRVIREELDRLPEDYRRPLALCYLEGLTHEQAATRLGWPTGTVKVRLVRARGRLRDRLERRGVALGVVALLFLLRRDASAEVASSARDAATIEAMTRAASGKLAPAGGGLAGSAAAVARPAGPSAGLPGWPAWLVALALLIASTGALALARQARADQSGARDASARLAAALEAGCR